VFLVRYLKFFYIFSSTINSADKAKPKHSVYMKILTNHFQLLSLVASIEYNWPAEIDAFMNSQKGVAEVTDQVFSVDCYLMDSDGNQPNTRTYYQKIIMFSFMPFLLALGCFVTWLIIAKCKNMWSRFSDYYISTIVVVLFLVHPNITKVMFSAFK
jgi:hypothetical protein